MNLFFVVFCFLLCFSFLKLYLKIFLSMLFLSKFVIVSFVDWNNNFTNKTILLLLKILGIILRWNNQKIQEKYLIYPLPLCILMDFISQNFCYWKYSFFSIFSHTKNLSIPEKVEFFDKGKSWRKIKGREVFSLIFPKKT